MPWPTSVLPRDASGAATGVDGVAAAVPPMRSATDEVGRTAVSWVQVLTLRRATSAPASGTDPKLIVDDAGSCLGVAADTDVAVDVAAAVVLAGPVQAVPAKASAAATVAIVLSGLTKGGVTDGEPSSGVAGTPATEAGRVVPGGDVVTKPVAREVDAASSEDDSVCNVAAGAGGGGDG